jgi:Zn-finger nucleic acid-binding protein
MNCPVCNIQLTMMERQGVEIDYCSKCRGVWLDRGELDKIIERGATASSSGFAGHNQSTDQHGQSGFNQPNQPGFNQPYQSGFNQQRQIHDSDEPHYGHHKKHKKREGFLSDLFDFD